MRERVQNVYAPVAGMIQHAHNQALDGEGIDAAECLLAFNPLDEAARRQMMELRSSLS